jgi:hypothetical protein
MFRVNPDFGSPHYPNSWCAQINICIRSAGLNLFACGASVMKEEAGAKGSIKLFARSSSPEIFYETK